MTQKLKEMMRRRVGIPALAVIILSVLMAGASVPAGAATLQSLASGSAATHFHGLGAKAPTVRVRATVPDRLNSRAAAPASVDLSSFAIPVGDQGQVGSCVAWASIDMMGYYANVQHRTGAPHAPMYIYSQINGGVDEGSSPIEALALLRDQGVAPQSVYTQGNYNWRSQPTAAEKAEAEGYKATDYTTLFSGDNQGVAASDAIKAALASGHPVMVTIPVYNNFFNLDSANSVMTLAMNTGELAGYHEIVAMGYNRTGVIIQNSWGTGWGRKGYATLAWDFVESAMNEADYNNGFVALPNPTVTNVTPSILPVSGGQVVVTGSGFATKELAATVGIYNPGAKPGDWVLPVQVVSSSTHRVTLMVPPAQGGVGGVANLVIANPTGQDGNSLSFSSSATVSRKYGGNVVIAGPAVVANGRWSVVETGSLTASGAGGCYANEAVAPAMSWAENSPGSPTTPLGLTVSDMPGSKSWPSGAVKTLGNVVVYGPGIIGIAPWSGGTTVHGDPTLTAPVIQNSLFLDARYASKVSLASSRKGNVVTLTVGTTRYGLSGRYVNWGSAPLTLQRWDPSSRKWVNAAYPKSGVFGSVSVKITWKVKTTWRVLTGTTATVWGGSTASSVR